MKRLICTDVHAVLPAFEAVVKAAGVVDEVIFLGDIVTFGPHPTECVDLLMSLNPICVRGNHDEEVLRMMKQEPARKRNDAAGEIWLQWTVERLRNDQLAFINGIPETEVIESAGVPVRLWHYPPYGESGYLHPDMPDTILAEKVKGILESVVYTGHNHRTIDRRIHSRDGHELRLLCFKAVGQAYSLIGTRLTVTSS